MMEHKKNAYWIIGAGKFGRKAATRLKEKNAGAAITMVDIDCALLKRLGGLEVDRVCDEGARYLRHNLEKADPDDWFIPAVPVHLALEWILLKLTGRGSLRPVPDEVAKRLPNPVRGPAGQVYASYADFVCPDNCREPFDRCTFTGKPRKGLLFQQIENIAVEGTCAVVIESRQLAPGVGGYQRKKLEGAFARVEQCQAPVVLFATACFCHGVIDAIALDQKRNEPQGHVG